MKEPPLFWMKHICDTLEDLKEIPLWGYPPAFPLEALSEKIATLLNLSEVKISVEHSKMRSGQEISSGLGAHIVCTSIELSPLSEPLYWLIGQEELRKLCTTALQSSSAGTYQNGKGFTSSSFQEGFYRFLGLQIAEAIDSLNAFNDLSIKMGFSRPVPKEESFCIDVGLHLPKQTLWGRIVCPTSFRSAFKAHFSMTPARLAASPLAREIEIPMQALIGLVRLHPAQLEKVKPGDFIILDHCSYDPSTHKGSAVLFLKTFPLLRVRLKPEGLKIVDYAFYYEENIMKDEESFAEEEPAEPEEELEGDENHLWSSSETGESPVEHPHSSQEVQLSLTVEVARLKINLEKLLHLQPGNVLELPVHPEQGVDLSIGGKKMAKAELVKLGDILGVKILQLSD